MFIGTTIDVEEDLSKDYNQQSIAGRKFEIYISYLLDLEGGRPDALSSCAQL